MGGRRTEPAAQEYIDAIPPQHRPLFDRVHGLILEVQPEADGEDGGLVARYPELSSGKGTLRITPQAAEQIADDELRALVRGALG